MPGTLSGKKIAILATNGVEQVELREPQKALRDAGAEVTVVSQKPGTIQGMNHAEKADSIPVDKTSRRSSSTDWCCRAAWRTRTICAWTSRRWRS